MKVSLIKSILNILLILFSIQLMAQRPEGQGGQGGQKPNIPPGKALVVGKVVDIKTETALQYATISVFNSSTKKISTGGITDFEGRFKIELEYGSYYIQVDYMGFLSKTLPAFEVSAANPMASMRKISIEPNSQVLGEVEVVEERQMFENKIDSKTFNVAKDMTMKNKTALETLEQIPSVSVDIDGNISLRGNGNIKILINDRPIVVSAANQAALLEQIQSDNIESIDVITNPSAKYDPEGMGGIINIQLKKSQPAGKNLSVSLSSDFIKEHGVNLSGGYRTDKFNLYGSYGFRYGNMNFDRRGENKYFFSDTTYYYNLDVEGSNLNLNHMATIGFEYNLNKKNTFGIELLGSTGSRTKNSPYFYEFLDENFSLVKKSTRHSTESDTPFKYDIQLNYKHIFSNPKHLLELSASRVADSEKEHSDYFETGLYPTQGDTINYEFSDQTEGTQFYKYSARYSQALSGEKSLELGYDGVLRFLENQIDVQVFDLTSAQFEADTFRNASFAYFDQTHAVYGLYKATIDKFSYQLGLRLEYNAFEFDLPESTALKAANARYNYYPSLHTMYKQNETTEWGLSYSKRVNRPGIEELNPIHDYSDAYNFRVGNPYLKPENIHAAELNLSKKIGKMGLMPALYFKYIDQAIKRYRTVDTTGISQMSYFNLDYGYSYGSELIISYRPFKWLDMNANANVGYYVLMSKDNDDLSNESFGWSAKYNAFIALPYSIKLQLSYFYNGKTVTPQGYIEPNHWADAGIRKMFWKDQLTFAIRFTDIFQTRMFRVHQSTDVNETYMQMYRRPSIALFSLTYQVGQTDQKQKQKRNSEGQGGGGEDMM